MAVWRTLAAALLPLVLASAGSGAPPEPLPYIIDQAAHDVSTALVDGFNVSLQRSFGVNAVAALSIDCATFLSALPGGPWYSPAGLRAVNSTRAAVRAMIAAAHSEPGVRAYLSSDLFQFPFALLAVHGALMTDPAAHCVGYNRSRHGCIALTNYTQYVYGLLFDELVESFPGLDGLVLRYGENSPCADHQGNAPYDSTSVDTMVSSLQSLLSFLREELCVKRNLTVVFRTWDTSTQYLHANASFYAIVTDALQPHPLLVFSVKHTMLDFWRRVRFNPTLGVGRHLQVVEAEVGGMYGGCGTWPLYVGDGIINNYEEDAEIGLGRGLTWLRDNAPSIFAGVLTNHQCTGELSVPPPWVWWRLEQRVISSWARDPSRAEAELFDEAVQAQLGIADASARAAFRRLTVAAMSANLRMQTCAAFDVQLLEVDRPTANWMQWNAWGGLEVLTNTNHSCGAFEVAHCEVFPFLVANALVEEALAEKDSASALYATLNASLRAEVLPHVPNASVAVVLAASVEAGACASEIVASGWAVMLRGFAGDRVGSYNVSAIRAAVLRYDAAWALYRGLAARFGPAAPGLYNASFWQHPQSHVPGMDQSVDRYRHL